MTAEIAIPQEFRNIRYNADHFPGAAGVRGFEGGANCQQYAYSILRHYGFQIPDFRSSELWDDTLHTRVVQDAKPFDLVLLHDTPESFGAHVGLCVGDGLVLHLSRRIGVPATEAIEDMQRRAEYRFLIGIKALLSRPGAATART